MFRLSQGITQLNQLNEDFTNQASSIEPKNKTYDIYYQRYAALLGNKSKLSNAINLVSDAYTIANVNPYASSNGYTFKPQMMQNIHQGIFKLAQGLSVLSRLNDDLNKQMTATNMAGSSHASINMNMDNGSMMGFDIFNSQKINFIIKLFLMAMIVLFILSIFGAISSLFKRSRILKNNNE